MTGSTSEIVFRPLPIDDPHQRKPDISVASAGSAGGRASISTKGCAGPSTISAVNWLEPVLRVTGATA